MSPPTGRVATPPFGSPRKASVSITSTPPGTVDARCMMCPPPEGTEPLRHSITRSSSALSRSANSSHDRPASSLSRSPKSFGKSSG